MILLCVVFLQVLLPPCVYEETVIELPSKRKSLLRAKARLVERLAEAYGGCRYDERG